MFIKSSIIFIAALFAFADAVPFLVHDREGQHYYFEPFETVEVLNRHRREEPKPEPKLPGPNDPKLVGEYKGNGKSQGGELSYRNPDGSGVDIQHYHTNGFGHTVSLDGRIPIWSSKNPYGESTINLGAGATEHYGGWPGNANLDKRVGLNFNHRF